MSEEPGGRDGEDSGLVSEARERHLCAALPARWAVEVDPVQRA